MSGAAVDVDAVMISFSVGNNARHASKLRQVSGDFDALADAVLGTLDHATKDGPFVCGPLRDGRRNKESAQPVAWLALDLDAITDELALLRIVEEAERWRGLAYTTHSHNPEAGNFKARAFFALDRAVTAAEYPRICSAVAAGLAHLAGVVVVHDAACAKPEQPLYTVRKGASVWRFDGELIRVDQALSRVPGVPSAAATGLEHIKTSDPVLRALQDQGRILRDMGGGKFAIRCPFESEHSREHTRDDSSSVYLLPFTNGYQRGHFACQHAHCSGRTDDAFRSVLGVRDDPPRENARSAGAMKRVKADQAGDSADASGDVQYCDFVDPVRAAHSIVQGKYTHEELRILHYWQSDFWTWRDAHYKILPLPDVRELLYRVGPACSAAPTTKARVDNVVDALRAAANLSHLDVPSAPAWIDATRDDPDPRSVIPVANGLVRIDDGALLAASPRFFAPYCLPFPYVADVAAPLAWLRFLGSVWPGDMESIHCLQEWMGYLLAADTSQQKGLMIVGPRRSGKGTIGRIIGRLLGAGNVASPTLASLGQPFGLQVLIGRTAALISDARLGGRADIAAIAENLLRITGEDEISVDRKFQEAYTARLLARVVIFSNEVPTFRDAASALPSRFVILRMRRSFLGAEDHDLERKLAAEMPGILAWALTGLRRLRARGRFVQPSSSADAVELMEDLASPISSFLRERCIVDPGASVSVQDAYEAWRDWCREHGRDQPGTQQTFGRDVAAAMPAVRLTRPRVDGGRQRYYSGMRLRTPSDPHDNSEDANELPL